MVIKTFRERELGCQGVPRCQFNLDSVIEGFQCRRLDEHFVESQQQGDLIPPLACSFSKANPHILALADEDGGLIIYNTSKLGLHAVQQDWLAHTNAVFDLAWMPGENQLLTASGDQSIILWDVTSEEKVATFRGHSSSVKTVSFRDEDNAVFATGSRDGHIMVWDKRVKQREGHIGSVNTVRNAHACAPCTPAGRKRRSVATQDSQQSVTAVVFQDDYTLVSTGSVDGSVKVWDLRRNYSGMKTEAVAKHIFPYPGISVRTRGYSSLVMDSTRSKLFASCMDNNIYQFDCATFSNAPEACFRGHLNSTFYVHACLSPDDQYLMSGSSDNSALVWRIDNPLASPLALKGHSSEVSAVAWCSVDIGKCVTSSDDGTMRVWRSLRREDTPDIGEVVGSTERTRREIGVTAHTPMQSLASPLPATPQNIRNLLTSPIKGTTLPHSPAKLSPAVRGSLLAMASTSGKQSPAISGKPSPKLVSPSITRWFRKPSSPHKASPMSPRKLLLTPKKLVDTPVKVNTPEALTPGAKDHGTKRKLDSNANDLDLESTPSKKACRKTPGGGGGKDKNTPRKTPKGAATPKPTRVLTPRSCTNRSSSSSAQISEFTSAKKSLFGGSDLKDTPTKLRQSPRLCQSPTINLPNYVLNPQPRVPVGKKCEDDAEKMPDWLTQIRLEKQGTDSKKESKSDDVPESSPAVPTPRGRRIVKAARRGERTPKRKPPACENIDNVTPSQRKGSARKPAKTPGSKAVTPSRRKTGLGSPTTPVSSRTPTTPSMGLRRRGSILEYFSPRSQQK